MIFLWLCGCLDDPRVVGKFLLASALAFVAVLLVLLLLDREPKPQARPEPERRRRPRTPRGDHRSVYAQRFNDRSGITRPAPHDDPPTRLAEGPKP